MRNQLLLFILIVLASCQSGPTQEEYDDLMLRYNECSLENADLKNTPAARLLKAQEYEADGNLPAAEDEYRELYNRFKFSPEADVAKNYIDKVESEREAKRIEEERIKQLGFKALTEKSSVKQGDVALSFTSTQLTSSWTFDRYDDYYHYRKAERGNIYITSTVSITSESKDPLLPPILVYRLQNGVLEYLTTATYEFYRWKDYGSYLGNYSDYSNDFAHAKTIRFSIGADLTESDIKGVPLFLMVKKSNCATRSTNRFGNPPVSYSSDDCPIDRALNVERADSEYFTIKVWNKDKI